MPVDPRHTKRTAGRLFAVAVLVDVGASFSASAAKGDDSVAAARGDCVVQMSMRASCALHESSSLDFLRCVSCFVSATPPCVVFENDVPFVLGEPWAPSFSQAHTLGAGLQISRALTGRGWLASACLHCANFCARPENYA